MVHRRPGAAADRDVTGGGRVVGRLEQRRVDHPQEAPGVLVDQAAAAADLEPGRAEQARGWPWPAPAREEDAVARLGADVRGQAGLLLVGDVLGDRPGQLAVLLDQHVGQPAGAALLGPLLPGVELLAGLRRRRRASPPRRRTAPGTPGTGCP